MIDKAALTARPVGIADAFVAPRLLTFQTPDGPSDALEVAFGHVESNVLPHVRRFIAGASDTSSSTAVKALIALHWARSQSMVEVYDRIFDQVFTDLATEIETDTELREAFQRSYGRPPLPDELRQTAAAMSEAWRRANNFFAHRVQAHYHRALDHFGAQNVQRIELALPHRVELMVADAPVVIVGGLAGLQGTAAKPVPLYEATSIWFPLAPHLGVTLTPRPSPDQQILPIAAQNLNMLSWRYANARLVARLDADLDRALGRRPGTIIRKGT